MHQALQYSMPDKVYGSASGGGGGAFIVDKFPRPLVELPVLLRCTGSSTSQETGSQAKTGAAPSSCESNRAQLKLSEKLS